MKKKHLIATILSSAMVFAPLGESIVHEGENVNSYTTSKVEEENEKEKRRANEKEEKDEKEVKKEKEYHSHFDVFFVNYDGKVLYHQIVPVGEDASYHGPKPHRDSTADEDFFFDGWDKTLKNIQCDTTFTAQYRSFKRKK